MQKNSFFENEAANFLCVAVNIFLKRENVREEEESIATP
jgi:hypothetical protein